MGEIFELYPNNNQLSYKDFFSVLENKWNCKLNDYEKVELTKCIDK